MEVLSDKEAKNYEGGALSVAGWALIGGIASFVLGVINGLTNSNITCSR